MSFFIEVILLIILVALSSFFSGSEVALVSIDKIKMRKLSKKRAKGIEILKSLKRKPRIMLTTILIGNNVVNIVMSSLATLVATNYFGSIGVGIAVGFVTFLILVFGEIVPKTYCEANNESIALFSAPIINFLSKIFYPFIIMFEVIPSILFKYVLKAKPKNREVTEQDILLLAEVGVEEKVIDQNEKETIEKVLKFGDTRIKKVLIPKKEVVYLNAETTAFKALETIDEEGHSRYPVFENRKSNIIGVVHIKEILRAIKDGEPNMKLKYLTINAIKILPEEKIDVAFKQFQKTHTHMALVYDKKDKLQGIVTFEDILEEIFGEIEDEEDIMRSMDMRKL